ncbi:DUF2291 family protein [Actinomyces qiguomingii]|uniref:DUF2291 family protein n=1 Tax=Actinomyces qiguomingii TaxID=2057800 RepID=UPI001304D505|nr:DUF2291 family protein [Actinomyces qiguomingii]
MARTNKTRGGRPWGVIVKAGGAVAILAVCFFGTTFMTPEEAEALLTAGSTDPVAYAEEHYDSTITYINDSATDLAGLIEDLRADEQGTSEELGKRDGEAAYTFAVTTTGTVQEGGFGQVDLAVEGVPSDVTVSVQTGPAVMGTALRDVTGEVTFDMFENQIDYAQVGLSLNDPLKTGVLADNDLTSMIGQEITVVGAFAYSDPTHVVITPISIQAAS